MKRSYYLLFNFFITGIVLVVFVISGIHHPPRDKVLKKCIHEELLGDKCPVCGMPEGFSEIIRGEFGKAAGFQKNSMAIFLFFLVMLIFRVIIISVILKTDWPINSLMNIDIVFSFLVFLFSFKDLAFQSIYIFYKMLITGNII